MSETEKLRALLAEARGLLSKWCWSGTCCALRQRIDAALAEPVEGPLNAVSRLSQQVHEARSNAEWLVQQAERERDEARTEVERLRKRVEEEGSLELALLEETGRALGKREWESVKDAAERIMSERDDARDDIVAAYQRGAEAMREAAAGLFDGRVGLAQSPAYAVEIRALPIPEDKP